MFFLRPVASRLLTRASRKASTGTSTGHRCLRGFSTHAYTVANGNLEFPSLDHLNPPSNNSTTLMDEPQLTSLLMELPDRVGVLHEVLKFFWKYDLNIRRIESRPSKCGAFDFFVDVEGGSERLAPLKKSLNEFGVQKLLTLGEKEGKLVLFLRMDCVGFERGSQTIASFPLMHNSDLVPASYFGTRHDCQSGSGCRHRSTSRPSRLSRSDLSPASRGIGNLCHEPQVEYPNCRNRIHRKRDPMLESGLGSHGTTVGPVCLQGI